MAGYDPLDTDHTLLRRGPSTPCHLPPLQVGVYETGLQVRAARVRTRLARAYRLYTVCM